MHSKRHRFLINFLRHTAARFVAFLMGYRCKWEKTLKEPYIIIANHNSNLDPVLVVLGLGHTYFVASEHAFRKGLPSALLKFVFDPIPISKAQTDSSTLREMFGRVKAGFSVCLFGEGNRSFNGVTGPVVSATAKMVKLSGAGLITYRLEGVYFTSPRWALNMRRGKTSGSITGRYSAAEIKSMTVEQILQAITQGIHEDAYERQKENPVRFKAKNRAQGIETVLYLCPACKRIGTIHSKGNNFFCDCGLEGIYTETGFLEIDSSSLSSFSTITAWDSWQREHLEHIVNNSDGGIICSDENQQLFAVDPGAGETLVGEGTLSISTAELRCAGKVFPLEDITRIAIAGQMLLQLAVKDDSYPTDTPHPAGTSHPSGVLHYDIRSPFPRNALKYREIYRIARHEDRL